MGVKQAQSPVEVEIRRMLAADLPAVFSNEQAAYEFPWTEGLLSDCLDTEGYNCAVVCRNDQVVGHGIVTAVVDEAHIQNLCIHPDYQGRGWGRVLLDWFIEAARRRELNRMFLEVRASNTPAIALYQAAGFVEIGRRRDYYPAPVGREDAVLLCNEIAEEDVAAV